MAEEDNSTDRIDYGISDHVIKALLPLSPSRRLRIYRTVGAFYGLENAFPKVDLHADRRIFPNVSREPQFSGSREPSPKEFLLQKNPKTNAERVACLAYYLAHFRGTREFKTLDINKLNTDAAQIKLSNASATIAEAVRNGYLADAAKGMKQLSAQGEKYVEALPDRNAAKAAKPPTQRRTRKKARANQAENDQEQASLDE